MKVHFLHLNENKTQVILFGRSDVLCGSTDAPDLLVSLSRSAVRNLGMIFLTVLG